MKIAVYRNHFHQGLDLFESNPNESQELSDRKFLGYIDLPIEKPKNTVVKEAFSVARSTAVNYVKDQNVTIETFLVPRNAKNIKCTYETEE